MDLRFLLLLLVLSVFVFADAKSLKKKQKTKGSKKLTASPTKSSCRLLTLTLQQDFDMEKFEGKWYGTMKTSIGDSILAYFTEIYDTRIVFTKNSKGGFDLRAAGSKFYGGWCPKGKGHSVIPSKQEPEKMTMYFDTKIGRQIGMKPAWILKTDYNNYAIIYSCWKELVNGSCDITSTYAAVIQRTPKTLSTNKISEINKALQDACIDPKRLSPITHYGYCVGREDF